MQPRKDFWTNLDGLEIYSIQLRLKCHSEPDWQFIASTCIVFILIFKAVLKNNNNKKRITKNNHKNKYFLICLSYLTITEDFRHFW